MCQYIKDNGDECGRDAEPFCHQHEDTRFAKLWRITEDLTVDDSGSRFGAMSTHCSTCEAPLQRTERLTEHPNLGGRVVFEAVVECDCSRYVLGATSASDDDVPAGWL